MTGLPDTPATTMRGPLNTTGFPRGLVAALKEFDRIRCKLRDGNEDFDDAESMASLRIVSRELRLLKRGLERMSWRGVKRIAKKHSGVCDQYLSGKMSIFYTLNGLFYWNDGCGETRRRILLLAWRKRKKELANG